jgi:hypothetical protein
MDFINDAAVKLDFQFYGYEDSSKKETTIPYRFNGTYKLIVKQDTVPLIQKGDLPAALIQANDLLSFPKRDAVIN